MINEIMRMTPLLHTVLTLVILTVVLGYENRATVHVACDVSGIRVHVSFEKPFGGAVYSPVYYMDPLCSTESSSNSTDVSLFLPVSACGTRVKENEDNYVLSNAIVVQQHRLIETPWDIFHPVSCTLSHPSRRAFQLPKIPGQSQMHYIDDELEAWIDLNHGALSPEGIHSDKIKVGDKLPLAIHVRDRSMHKDMKVTTCVAHDEAVVGEETKLVQILDESSCRQSELLSEFKVTKRSNVSDIVAYSNLNVFKFSKKSELYLTCSVQLCRESCLRTCQDSRRNTVMNHPKRFKRYAEETVPAIRNLEERNRLMKATIKALASKLVKYRGSRILDRTGKLDDRYQNPATIATPSESEEVLSSESSEEVFTSSEFFEDPTTEVLPVERHVSKEIESFSSTEVPADELRNFNVTIRIIVMSPGDKSQDHLNEEGALYAADFNCVPKLRFAMVTGMLSFILFCVILTCIIMTLYFRKEKKKKLIDNFLLYNFD